jgi:two-component system, autoinducer 2 sensor kinase/phosphatase LuxQ
MIDARLLESFKYWPDALIFVGQQGLISALSNEALALLDCSEAQLLGKKAHQYMCSNARSHLHEEENCPFHSILNSELHLGSNDASSSLWVRPDGEHIHVDYRRFYVAEFSTLVISFQDNSEKRHSQAEMQRLSDFTELNPACIAEFDEFGEMLFSNPALTNLMMEFGFDDDSGQANILPNELAQLCRQCLDQLSSIERIEHHSDGFVYEWSLYPMESEQGTNIMAYAFDVTEKFKAEQIQKLAEEKSIEQEKADKRDFFAKMMHELRTPLNAIIGYADLILRKGENFTEKQIRQLNTIKSAGHQLGELVTDTLELSKIEAVAMTLNIDGFSLESLLQSVQQQLEGLAEAKDLELKLRCDASYILKADRQKVLQILINLVSNAIKYTSRGYVLIHVEKVLHAKLGASICIRVADTGMGMSENQIPLLFKAYQRLNEDKTADIQGTGLGLSLVQELVHLHEGEIEVVSTAGKGSIFSVFFKEF